MRSIPVAFVLLTVTLACTKREPPQGIAAIRQEYEGKIAKLSDELRILRFSVYKSRTFLPDYEMERLKKYGIANPGEDILSSLEKQSFLLNEEAGDGQTPQFAFYGGESFIVRPGVVLGYFEDGHSSGYALLDYQVRQNDNPGSKSKIEWKLRCKRLD